MTRLSNKYCPHCAEFEYSPWALDSEQSNAGWLWARYNSLITVKPALVFSRPLKKKELYELDEISNRALHVKDDWHDCECRDPRAALSGFPWRNEVATFRSVMLLWNVDGKQMMLPDWLWHMAKSHFRPKEIQVSGTVLVDWGEPWATLYRVDCDGVFEYDLSQLRSAEGAPTSQVLRITQHVDGPLS